MHICTTHDLCLPSAKQVHPPDLLHEIALGCTGLITHGLKFKIPSEIGVAPLGSTSVYLGVPSSTWVQLGLLGSTWVYLGLLGST